MSQVLIHRRGAEDAEKTNESTLLKVDQELLGGLEDAGTQTTTSVPRGTGIPARVTPSSFWNHGARRRPAARLSDLGVSAVNRLAGLRCNLAGYSDLSIAFVGAQQLLCLVRGVEQVEEVADRREPP